jgi:hypothetical protein
MGTPLEGPLSVYGPVQPWNANAALWLLRGQLATDLRTASRTWASLPERVRRRIEIEAMLIRIERIVAELERVVEEYPQGPFPWYTDEEFAADFLPQKRTPLVQIGGAL